MNETTLVAILFLCPLLDAGAMAFVLFFPWEKVIESETLEGKEPCITVPRLFLGLLAAGGVFVFKLPLLIVLGLDGFGLIHVTYLDLVVGAPSVGVAILIASSRLGRPAPWIAATPTVRRLALIAVLCMLGGVQSSLIEPARLQLEQATVTVSPQRVGSRPLRVGVVADIQTDAYGSYERRAVERLMAESPDLILMPGDFFQGSHRSFEREFDDIRQVLGRLKAPGGVFAVLGNTDLDEDRVRLMLSGSDIRLLRNEAVTVSIHDRQVTVAGVDTAWHGEGAAKLLADLESSPDDGDFRVVLSHYPDVIEKLPAGTRVDLVVAGHTHGGQIVLPGFGPPMTLSRVPRRIAAGGLHELDGRRIYVSRGLGMERAQAPRIRLFCPPEINILDLRTGPPRGH